jgi:antibiotic biosynthesis monooxygenase (ABM) superfamily enzyme
MGEAIHIAITRRVRKERVGEFQAALAEFARRSLVSQGRWGFIACSRYPVRIQQNLVSCAALPVLQTGMPFINRLFTKKWLGRSKPMIEGDPAYRRLDGLEAWFYNPQSPLPPPKWKMALVTWFAVVMLLLLLNPLFAVLFHSFPYIAQVLPGTRSLSRS